MMPYLDEPEAVSLTAVLVGLTFWRIVVTISANLNKLYSLKSEWILSKFNTEIIKIPS